jgi:hypothetical protein
MSMLRLHVHGGTCPCCMFMSMLYVHVEVHTSCPFRCQCPYCIYMSTLHVYAPATHARVAFHVVFACFMSMMRAMLSEHTACSFYISMLHIHAAHPCCASMLRIFVACPCFLSMQLVHYVCPCYISMVYVHAVWAFAAYPCCVNMLLVHTAWPCWLSLLNVFASCPVEHACFMSMLHVHHMYISVHEHAEGTGSWT